MLAGCMPWHSEVTPSVSGTVLDASSGKPIAGAFVHIEDFPEKTAFTKEGRFVIAEIREWVVLTPPEFGGDRRPA